MEEIWKDLYDPTYPGYQASSTGFIRSFWDFHGQMMDEPRILKPSINKDGYYELTLYSRGDKRATKRVHRLIANTFLGEHPGLVVNHINGNKLDNRIENLEFVTAEKNSTLASQAGLYKTKPIRIIETGEVFRSIKECADAIDTHPSNISVVLTGKGESSRDLHFELVPSDDYKTHAEKKRKPFLYPHQKDAVNKMFNGCVLNGTVGSGKSRAGLYYYFSRYGGSIDPDYVPMKNPADLYILTTAKKRNDLEWDGELSHFLMARDPEINYYKNKIIVDSWQNIRKYDKVTNAFFMFDENKINGKGAWAKSFLKITKNNEWIILSASNGDRWEDFETLFLAEGFFRTRGEFRDQHLIYSRYTKYPKVNGYRNEGRLFRLRDKILIDMDFQRHTVQHHENIYTRYDIAKYKDAMRTRWDPYKDCPIEQASGLCYVLRRIVNEDESRQMALLEILEDHPKAIIFYNFDPELDILLNLGYAPGTKVAQYNGHKHEPIPMGDKWVYLVNYNACEAWNTTSTNCMIFYSQTYSYKTLIQASGRIDRLTTPYNDLYYFHLKSRSGIDLAISKALREKKQFNEQRFVKW